MRFVSLVGMVILAGTAGCMAAQSAAPVGPEVTIASGNDAAPKSKEVAGAKKKAAPGDERKADEAALKGNLWGDTIGDSFGEGGLGLTGTGPGGGGTGEGIGLGSVGTLGHGAGTGTGQGFGSGSGRLGGSHTGARGKVSAATATTTGDGLPAEVIQRIIRQNVGQIRLCYETAMTKNPTLSGKVALKFTIDGKGGVSQAAVGDTTIADADMVTCLVSVVKRLSFPAPEAGGSMTVTYPLQFAPGDS